MLTNKQLKTVIRIEAETNNNNARRSDDDDEASVADSVHCRDSVALTACCSLYILWHCRIQAVLDYIWKKWPPLLILWPPLQ